MDIYVLTFHANNISSKYSIIEIDGLCSTSRGKKSGKIPRPECYILGSQAVFVLLHLSHELIVCVHSLINLKLQIEVFLPGKLNHLVDLLYMYN